MSARDILGEYFDSCRTEVMQIVRSTRMSLDEYRKIERILFSYGIEMDYFEEFIR